MNLLYKMPLSLFPVNNFPASVSTVSRLLIACPRNQAERLALCEQPMVIENQSEIRVGFPTPKSAPEPVKKGLETEDSTPRPPVL